MSKHFVSLEDSYSVGTVLGEGSSSTVRLCEHKRTKRAYACKSMANATDSGRKPQQIINEVQIHRDLSHSPTVLRFHDVLVDNAHVHVIMEVAQGGDLFDYLGRLNGSVSEETAADIFFQVGKAVQHCHANNIMHRDIKPENIFLTRQDPTAGQRSWEKKSFETTVKLGDFGLATVLAPGDLATRLCGSATYMAPEVYQGRYGYPADVWSLGILLYILLTGFCPFNTDNLQEVQRCIAGQGIAFPEEIWYKTTREGEELVRRMLQVNPALRPNINEVLTSEWVQHFFPDAASWQSLDGVVLEGGAPSPGNGFGQLQQQAQEDSMLVDAMMS